MWDSFAKTIGTPSNPSFVWVQIMQRDDDLSFPSSATAFKVSPTMNDIDSLKKAVKVEIESNTGERVNAFIMKVYAHNPTTGKWEEVMKARTPLVANSEVTAYHVVVPK